jgi:hypothetical protein
MNKVLILLVIIGFVSITTAQEKWSHDPKSMSKPPIGNYSELPDNNYHWENYNHTTKVYYTKDGVLSVGPSFRVFPNTHQQDEVVLVKSYAHPLVLFGSANTTVGSTYGQAAYITTNGGLTWTGTDAIPAFNFATSDPAPAIDKDGNLIITTLNTNTGTTTMNSATSTNNGVTWQPNVLITGISSDKNFSASDDVPTSPYYGRTYTVWTNFYPAAGPIMVSYTTNGGASWSAPAQINTPLGNHYSQGADINIGANGEVYVCWAAPLVTSGNIEDYAGFAKSTNGGVSWTVTENAFDMNGIRAQSFNGWNFRVNSFPRIAVDRSGGARNGWVYIVVSQVNLAPAGSDVDIIMHSSSDGGITWTAGVRVNQDALNNGKVQFFPAITVDPHGDVDICYYDNRNYPSVGDSCQTYFSRSTDGGVTFSDVLASDHSWRVQGEPGFAPYGGDYIGISNSNGKIYPFWYDFKTSSMQAWTCAIDINPIAVNNISNEIPKSYNLQQNYPNPFNPTTNIKFDVPKSGNVKLTVYDILGDQVELLVNNYMVAGSYSTDFHANNLSSGVYFYKLEAGSFSETRKMILNK